MPRREDEKPRRTVVGYNGRRVGGGRSGQGRGSDGPTRGGAATGGRGGSGGRSTTRGGRGRSYRRDNEAGRKRIDGGDRRRPGGENGGSRFGRRGNRGGDNNNNQKQQQQRLPNNVKVDPATLQLLRSLQDRIRALESQRPLLNSKGQAVQRFARQVDRAAGDVPRRPQQQQQQRQNRPQTRRQTDGRGVQRARSPDDRRNSRRGGGRRAEHFSEGRRGGVRDRYDWDEGLESREKRRRRDTHGPQDPSKYPPLRVRVGRK